MQIDPKVAMWLNLAYVIVSALTAGTLQAAGIANFQQIAAYAGLIAIVLNAVMHAFSSSIPGPLAPPDPPVVKRAMIEAQVNPEGK